MAVSSYRPRNQTLESALVDAFASAGWHVDIGADEPPTASYDDACASTTVRLGEELMVENSQGFPEIVIQRIELARGLHGARSRLVQAGKWCGSPVQGRRQ